MNEFSNLMVWPTNQEQLCEEIVKSRSPLKIVLKTKDEIELLEPWLTWHIGICGIENIIVFDHGSTLAQIADVYRTYPELKVCRYRGHLDSIHHRPSYEALYRALEKSALHYAFIDTDEFVTLALNATCHDKGKILDFLDTNNNVDVFPSISLTNRRGSRTKVYLGAWNGQMCGSGLLWGKPFVKAGTDLGCESWLHNCWIKKFDHNLSFKSNIVLLHLNQLSFERQKRVTLHKFISKGRVPERTSVDELMTNDDLLKGQFDEVRRLILDFRSFVRRGSADWIDVSNLRPPGVAEFSDDGLIVHSSDVQRDEFQRLLDDQHIFPRVVAMWNEQNKSNSAV